MTEAKQAVISESDAKAVILRLVAEIKAKATEKGDVSKWSTSMHASLVWQVALELGLEPDCKADFQAYGKAVPGLFGNASQFAQHEDVEKIVGEKSTRTRKLEIYD